MAWTSPPTFTVGEVAKSSDLNVLSGDISLLAGAVGNTVGTSETTTSTGYTDLATPGPAVTVTTGANALVTVTAQLSNGTPANQALMAYAISGATTLAATDATCLMNASAAGQFSATYEQTGLTPGSNTFTAKYRVGGTTGTFLRRNIIVQPLP